ncbi:MAG: hypothetical protein JKY61_00985 [Planctomycetes bacterium]|nr:hypothetical protein [Planctomycetota bacterium]
MSGPAAAQDSGNASKPLPNWALLAEPCMRDHARDLRVAVLLGGTSSEREVCLVSGRAMLDALCAAGDLAPQSVIGIEIAQDGRWILEGETIDATRAIDRLHPETVFMLGLHGGDGEGGPMQGFLKLAGRAHTGTGLAASVFCMDKIRSRQVFVQAGLRVAPGVGLWPHEIRGDLNAQVQRVLALGPGPWFLKPSLGGSSVSMGHARNEQEIVQFLNALPELEPGEGILVEQAIKGVEVTVGLLAAGAEAPTCLPVVEIQPSPGAWFDFKEKYSDSGALEWCPPKNLSPARQEQVQVAARKAWYAVGLSGYARLDFIVPAEGEPVFLEANTLPGFTPRSLFPMAAGVAGLPFNELCVELCLRGWVDHQQRNRSGEEA